MATYHIWQKNMQLETRETDSVTFRLEDDFKPLLLAIQHSLKCN